MWEHFHCGSSWVLSNLFLEFLNAQPFSQHQPWLWTCYFLSFPLSLGNYESLNVFGNMVTKKRLRLHVLRFQKCRMALLSSKECQLIKSINYTSFDGKCIYSFSCIKNKRSDSREFRSHEASIYWTSTFSGSYIMPRVVTFSPLGNKWHIFCTCSCGE